MASQTISGQRWADGTTVGVYPAAAWPDPTQAPSGSAVTTAAVAGGAVTFTGLAENVRYVAYAGGLGVRFVVPQQDPTDARSLRSRVDELAGDTVPALQAGTAQPGGIYIDGIAWAASRTFRDGNKDGIFYIRNLQDASGTVAPTYTKGFGQWGSKGSSSANGHGNLDAFWASYAHYGDGEVGLFIGDVTAKTGGAAGNLWGGHFQLNAEVAANMRGLHIELVPAVNVSAKGTIGLDVSSVDAFQCNNGVRVRGNFDRPIIVYGDNAGTTINFDVDSTGALRTRGHTTPLGSSGTYDLGSTGARWRSLHVNNASVNQGNFFGMAGGIIIGSGTAPSQTITGSSSALWSSGGRLQHQGDDMVVTTLGPTFISGDSAKGIVLKDNAGTPHYWRVTVSSAGVLTTTDLGTTRPSV